MMQSYITNINKEKKKEKKENGYHYKKNYLHFIKQTLTKIYKTFKSFESVKNVQLCHRMLKLIMQIQTNAFSTGQTSYAGTLL